MDPAACKVIYIDDRFNTERWITRAGASTPVTPKQPTQAQADFADLPLDLQCNINAFLTVFNQVFVCHSGRLFSSKLSELHEAVKIDCTPIIACFDVGTEAKQGQISRAAKPRFSPSYDSPLPSPTALRREFTFSSESDESYGLQLLSRIASDLQVEEDSKVIIPVAIVRPKRKDSYDRNLEQTAAGVARSPYGSETVATQVVDTSDAIDPQVMLQCLDAGALDVVKSPLDKAGIMGLTVHAYRRHKMAKKEQASFMSAARKARKQSWVGVDGEEQPYAYLREAMVRKLLRGICEPETTIEGFQGRELFVDESRKPLIAQEVGKWGFDGHIFEEDELVYAGYCMLNHALTADELDRYRMDETHLLQFMQGCRVAYNHFVLYHNFRHAVDVLQSVFYFLVQIGILPPYPVGAESPPQSNNKSPVAKLLTSFEALTLLVSAIGHDVGHPGVNNMFLVKLNAPLAQLYNDQSVLEAFHCAAYSQILRRHWPAAFHDKALRRLMISSILATDMGVHADYMQQLGNLQERIHQSKNTDGWSPKDLDAFRVLTCGLLIKCADISNVARPWVVAEKWTHLLQKEFANQGEMEHAVGIETTLFGGPPELGNVLKLANGQIGFMTIFAHPLFANVSDIIPAMHFAADEILTNKGVWFTKAEHEKRREALRRESHEGGQGAVSPRSQSPAGAKGQGSHLQSPLREIKPAEESRSSHRDTNDKVESGSRASPMAAVTAMATEEPVSRRSSKSGLAPPPRPSSEQRKSIQSLRALQTAGDSVNGTGNRHSTISEPAGFLQDGANDDRRDMGTSMRAGTEHVPDVTETNQPPSKERSPSPLAKFTFATSNEREPVRTYDPEQHYPPIHASARASMPANDTTQLSAADRAAKNTSKSTPTIEEFPSATTTATQSTTDETGSPDPTSTSSSAAAAAHEKSEFEKKRARAASAPTPAEDGGASLRARPPPEAAQGGSSQRSLRSGLFGGSSRDSSKQDVRMVNGETWEGGGWRRSTDEAPPGTEGRGSGMTTPKERGGGGLSVGGTTTGGSMRRRSRIRLAFWKKKKNKNKTTGSSEDVGLDDEGRGGEEEEEEEDKGSGVVASGRTSGVVDDEVGSVRS